MPKPITRYQCNYCTDTYDNIHTCLEHECKEHLHITIDDYKTWEKLKTNVRYTACNVSNTKNQETEKAFDTAIQKLMEFEEQNHLTDIR